MVDLFVALAQFLSLLGLLYGAFLCLAHYDCADHLRSKDDRLDGHEGLEQPPFLRPNRSADESGTGVPPEERLAA